MNSSIKSRKATTVRRNLFTAVAIAQTLACTPIHAEEQNHAGMMQSNMMQMAGPKIDVPVVLKEAKVIFRIDRLAQNGDNSFALQQIAGMSEKLRQMGAESKVVAVFNGDGGFMLLNDIAYNDSRKARDGNPYKSQIAKLIAQGIEVEECGMTMMREGWMSKQLLPGVKVNAGANLRVVDLAQKGYVLLGQ